MSKIGYLDCRKLTGSVDAEDAELLGMFAGQRESAGMILFRDGMTLWLEPKAAVMAKAKAAKARKEREAMEEERRKKLLEDKRKTCAWVVISWVLVGCGACLLRRVGNPGAWMMTISGILLAWCAADAAQKRKAARECRQC